MSDETVDKSSRQAQLEKIILAYLKAVDAGRKPDHNAILARFPDLTAELKGFFADQEDLRGKVAPLRAGTPAKTPRARRTPGVRRLRGAGRDCAWGHGCCV
jgi:hypothetical protein